MCPLGFLWPAQVVYQGYCFDFAKLGVKITSGTKVRLLDC